MVDWLWYVLMLVAAVLGLLVTVFTLPGIWLLFIAYVVYAWTTGWDRYVGWPSVIGVAAIGLAAELLEFLAGSAGAKKAGGSKRAMIGAIAGALLGGLFFTGLIPVPIVGTIFGVCLGAFVGAALVEHWIRGDIQHTLRVGTGAATGRFLGIVIKLGCGVAMLIVVAIAGLPWGDASPATVTPVASSQPASISTAPATTTAPATRSATTVVK